MIDTLCRLLDAGVTQFHVVKECEAMLQDHGYMELDMGERWELHGRRKILCEAILIYDGGVCRRGDA